MYSESVSPLISKPLLFMMSPSPGSETTYQVRIPPTHIFDRLQNNHTWYSVGHSCIRTSRLRMGAGYRYHHHGCTASTAIKLGSPQYRRYPLHLKAAALTVSKSPVVVSIVDTSINIPDFSKFFSPLSWRQDSISTECLASSEAFYERVHPNFSEAPS